MLVYDVGMNTGEDTARYLAAGHDVVGIEADPLLCALCYERFADEIENTRLHIVQVAIAPQDGLVPFWRNSTKPGWSSIFNKLGVRGDGGVVLTINGMRFEDILRQHGMPWYLKSDIEGADYLCLEALAAFELRPEYVSVELARNEWPLMLKKLGYNLFALVDQAPFNANGDNPDLPEVSGPLPDAIGEWFDLETVMEQFRAGKSWYDIYAKMEKQRYGWVERRSAKRTQVLGVAGTW
ncbi:MAG: FkbM family methyltransferase [Gammaproteobacteria bacterium]|nr:FkbM family methyltransferase [Gammaproteobacteria bacterium]